MKGVKRKSFAISLSFVQYKKSEPFTPAVRKAAAGPRRSSPSRKVASSSTVHSFSVSLGPRGARLASGLLVSLLTLARQRLFVGFRRPRVQGSYNV